jgi:minor extracellular serine protease Vpr
LQIKSALVNTATQDLTDSGHAASIVAVGAGKLNVADAVSATLTVSPQTASFGVAASLPKTQSFVIHNHGTAAADIQLSVEARTTDGNASIEITPASLTLGADQSETFSATLTGSAPAAGSYEGFIVLRSSAATLRIPYLYLVSDHVTANIVPLLGDGGTGLVGDDVPDGMLAFEVIDKYGLPVPNVPATFAVIVGGGQIAKSDTVTNAYGIATAEALLGSSATTNVFSGNAGSLGVRFSDAAVAQPVIADGGVVNAASFDAGAGIAPGEYISIFGSNLSVTTLGSGTTRLPLSIRNVSVSFDVPEASLSVPGHLTFVSPRQVNVQVPWELQGQRSVQMKVSISAASGKLITVPVNDYAPGLFAVAQDANFVAISTDHPAIPGQTVILYGTGLGPVNNVPPSGDPAADASSTTLTTPLVSIGGIPARVDFSGLVPGYAGLYQVNVTVPSGIASGSRLVTVSVNNVAANPIPLPVQ